MTSVDPAPLLTVDRLQKHFGGLLAVNDLSFSAKKAEITAIIGPNGAGKTTVFNCLTGFYKPNSGKLRLNKNGASLALERPRDFQIARAGIARTFQNIRLFPSMSVLENLIVAQHGQLMRASWFTLGALFNLKHYKKIEKEAVEYARFWLERTDLIKYADQDAGNLDYGNQRRLEIARAMCTKPVLLCLDEPAAGLNPRESAALNELLTSIRAEGSCGVLLIEHDMSVVMEISDNIIVLDYGRKIASGKPDAIRKDPAVIRAYLGTDDLEGINP